jgi:hypothetical protein
MHTICCFLFGQILMARLSHAWPPPHSGVLHYLHTHAQTLTLYAHSWDGRASVSVPTVTATYTRSPFQPLLLTPQSSLSNGSFVLSCDF